MVDNLSMHKVQDGDILLPRRGKLDRRSFITTKQVGWICGTGSIRIRSYFRTTPQQAVGEFLPIKAILKTLSIRQAKTR